MISERVARILFIIIYILFFIMVISYCLVERRINPPIVVPENEVTREMRLKLESAIKYADDRENLKRDEVSKQIWTDNKKMIKKCLFGIFK